MLAKRLIPCLDIKDGMVVKGVKFEDVIPIDDPVALSAYYADQGADELVFYDITASHERRKNLFDLARRVADTINIPFTIGGGIASLDDFDEALKSGADKVSINSSAVADPDLINAASKKYGAQCVVLSIDGKREAGDWYVYLKGGRVRTDRKVLDWALEGQRRGAGEIVMNSIDQDGVKTGYDLELLSLLTDNLSIPVIASGGAGSRDHILEAFTLGGADAALAASIFHRKEIMIPDLKHYLRGKGLIIR